MKILAFTDIHADKKAISKIMKKSQDADLLICCGDFTNFGYETENVIRTLNKINKTILLIHGNHEEWLDIKKICSKYKNIVYLHKNIYSQNDLTFLGYGGGGFARVNKEMETYMEKISKKIKNKLILITHGPPANTKLDHLPWAGHVGCASIRKIIQNLKPIIFLCGHLHENFNKTDKLGKTLLINPGPEGRIIKI